MNNTGITCCNCHKTKNILISLPMYGYVCGPCYQEIIVDYLK